MSAERKVNFRLDCNAEFLDEQYRSKLAFINDILPSQVEWNEVKHLVLGTLLGTIGITNDQLPKKYLGEHKSETGQKFYTFCMWAESLLQRELGIINYAIPGSEVGVVTYGIHGRSYLNALQKYSETKELDQASTRSLLVGALTPATVTEYAAITNHVFPGSENHVLDIDTEKIKQVCQSGLAHLTKGDGFKMPFNRSSFDIVQSDFLMYYLSRMPMEIRSESEIYESYFENTHRILKKGGLLLMVDHIRSKTTLDEEKQMVNKEITGLLSDAGFKDIKIEPGHNFKSRRDLDKCIMLGNNWEFTDQNIQQSKSVVAITAVKK